MKVISVTYLCSFSDEVSVSAEVFPTKEQAHEYINNEKATLQEDYPNWSVVEESDDILVFGTENYENFVEFKITEHELNGKN